MSRMYCSVNRRHRHWRKTAGMLTGEKGKERRKRMTRQRRGRVCSLIALFLHRVQNQGQQQWLENKANEELSLSANAGSKNSWLPLKKSATSLWGSVYWIKHSFLSMAGVKKLHQQDCYTNSSKKRQLLIINQPKYTQISIKLLHILPASCLISQQVAVCEFIYYVKYTLL